MLIALWNAIVTRLTYLGGAVATYFAIHVGVTLYEMFYSANDDPSQWKPTYVPQSKRWKKFWFFGMLLWSLCVTTSQPLVTWISGSEGTWHAYRAHATLNDFRRARRLHKAAFASSEDYEPLTMESWLARKFKRHKRRYNHPIRLLVAKAAETQPEGAEHKLAKFDTDSAKVGVDNRASACISHKKSDFEGKLVRVYRSIKGFGGERIFNVYKGTLVWKWCDNEGKVHKFRIPNSYYVPQGNCRLLSPQHWARTQLGPYATASRLDGIGETTTHNKCVLFWDIAQFSLDIYMGPTENVATF